MTRTPGPGGMTRVDRAVTLLLAEALGAAVGREPDWERVVALVEGALRAAREERSGQVRVQIRPL